MARKDPNQLRMFMSAHEITSEYAPNQADRNYHGTDYSVSRVSGVRLQKTDPRAGEPTARTSRTDESPNLVNPDAAASKPNIRSHRSMQGEYAHPETNEQLYGRKLRESQRPVGSGQPSLYQRVQKQGVLNPIALGEHQNAAGQRQVAGGHHRLAIMQHLNPHQLLPVVHVQSVLEANATPGL